jgi:hypothetical protein
VKFLSPRVHGYLDYAVVLLLALAPTLFGFSGTPAALCYIVAILQMGMSLMTSYPLGLARVIPFTLHGAIELVAAIGLILSPYLFDFGTVDAARNFFIISGVALAGVWLTTDYKAATYGWEREVAAYNRKSFG